MMNELANKIQIAMNTIEAMTIPATFDNANKLMGLFRILAEVRDALEKPAEVIDDVQP